MRAVFLGVGEAFDEALPNTSVLVRAESEGERKTVLLDCGYSVPPAFWRHVPGPEELDAVWISHFHADHFFGVPALLLRFWEFKRQKPLLFVGQTGIEDLVHRVLDLAYPNFLRKLTYPLEFAPVEPGSPLRAVGLNWRFAENGHGQRDLAVRIEDAKSSVFYSGDGMPTPETVALARDCKLAVHEAFRFEGTTPGHGSIKGCIDFAREAGVSTLALVHLQRHERRDRREEILKLLKAESAGPLKVILPEPGDELEV